MKITREEVTVLPDATTGDISLLMAGLRITFNADEAQNLAKSLAEAVRTVRKDGAPSAPAEAAGSNSADLDSDKVLRGLQSLMGSKTTTEPPRSGFRTL